MKFLGQEKIAYCPHYDRELYSKTPLRVSTPIHTGSAERHAHGAKWTRSSTSGSRPSFPRCCSRSGITIDFATDGEPTFESLEEWIRGNVDAKKLNAAMTVYRGFIERFESGDLVDRD